MRLKDKVAFITGSGSGIGRGVALLFAEEGAKIVVAEIVEQNGLETVSMIEKQGGEALFIKVDVSKLDDIVTAVKKTVEHFQKIDILVNSAGILGHKPFVKITENEWDRMMAINMKGSFFCAQAVAKEMIRSKTEGSIINVGSVASEFAIEFQSHYMASKGGIKMMSMGMALELAPHNIRVNTIAPGIIMTGMTQEDLMEEIIRDRAVERVPLGRIGTPLEVARVVLFLASEESAYITGSIIFITGGLEITV